MRPAILVLSCGHLMLSSLTHYSGRGEVRSLKLTGCCSCGGNKGCYPDCVTPGHAGQGIKPLAGAAVS